MNDNTQVTEVEVIELEAEQPVEVTEVKTEGQLDNEAKTDELREIADATMARMDQSDEAIVNEAEVEVGILRVLDEVYEAADAVLGKVEVAKTSILCADGLPIMTPEEVRSMRDGLGISRPMLIELAGINGYRCWAAEQAHKADELDVIEWRKIVSVVLRQVDKDGLPAEMQPKKRGRKPNSTVNAQDAAEVEQLKSQLNEAQNLLSMALLALQEINECKSLKEAKAKATAALELLTEDDSDDQAEDTTEA